MVQFDLLFNLATLEIGSWISTFLFGICTMQAYTYYRRSFHSDKLGLKLLTATVWICELVHTAGTTSGFFTSSITLYGQPERIFAKSPLGYTISTLMSGIIATLVQIYFANRIRMIRSAFRTRLAFLTYLCWVLSLIRFLGSVSLFVILLTKDLEAFQRTWVAAVTWAIGSVVDVLIAVPLTINLSRYRHELIRLKTVVDQLIAMIIQTGVLTSISTITIAICFLALPHTLVWGAVGSALAKIFSISLFAFLNARDSLRRLSDESVSVAMDNVKSPLAFNHVNDTSPVSTHARQTIRSSAMSGQTVYFSLASEKDLDAV